MATILITGGTGTIGTRLTSILLGSNHKVIILTRSLHHPQNISGVTYALWDNHSNPVNTSAFLEADAIVHLAGAPVMDKRWTTSYKKEIYNSRIHSLELIINKLAVIPRKVK